MTNNTDDICKKPDCSRKSFESEFCDDCRKAEIADREGWDSPQVPFDLRERPAHKDTKQAHREQVI